MSPWAPAVPCSQCRQKPATYRGRCDDCNRTQRRQREVAEPWHGWYSLARWKALRLRVLKEEPICLECEEEDGVTVASEEVDHVEPHRGNVRMFYDRANLKARCKMHHSRRTMRQTLGRG